MDGVELSPHEFAYLLAVVHAPAVVGVDDPLLFPSDAKSREHVYGQGRQQLEQNKWIEPIPDQEGEYDLDPALVHMVAVVAGPEHVIATVRAADDGARRTTLHYLFGNKIVELWSTPDESYLLGVVEDRSELVQRITEMLQVAEQSDAVEFRLPEAAFQQVLKFAENGNSDKAEALLESAGKHAAAFTAALGQPGEGQLFVVEPSQGEIQGGRRATVVAGSWLVFRTSADSDELEVSSLDAGKLDGLLAEWLE